MDSNLIDKWKNWLLILNSSVWKGVYPFIKKIYG